VIPDLWQPAFTVVNMRAIWWDRSRSFSVARREEYVVEARSEQSLRGRALSTLEAMVISMGFIAPSVAMFSGMDDFAKDTARFDTLTRKFLADGWAPFVGLAALTGAIALAIGIHNSTVRLLYALERDGVLPGAFARVHPTRRSPWVAASIQAGFSMVLGLIFGYFIFGDPATTYGYFGDLGTLAVLFVYIFINVSVLRHALISHVATAAVCLPIYGLIYPVADPPYNLWPYLIALWAVIGLAILFIISRRRPDLVEAMGHAFSEAGVDEPDTAQEDVMGTRGRDTTEEQPGRGVPE
jgi:amino acid transporter